jgi:hypothetical protein
MKTLLLISPLVGLLALGLYALSKNARENPGAPTLFV